MFPRKRCTIVLYLVVFHASRIAKADSSVKKEMVYSVVKDIHGDALCATDEPNQILTARSKLSCFAACQDKPKCWAANWKLPNSCEHYSYNPRGYQVETGCIFMIPGRLRLYLVGLGLIYYHFYGFGVDVVYVFFPWVQG